MFKILTMKITNIVFLVNTFKAMLITASPYQGELFTTGCTLWGWTPPQFHNLFCSY